MMRHPVLYTMLELVVTIAALAVVVFFAAVVAGLSGCAEYRAVETGVAQHGAEAADGVLRDSLWTTCEAATVGAVRRWTGGNADLIRAYDSVCQGRPHVAPLLPQEAKP